MKKRHVIYLSYEEWADIQSRAERLDMTASAYIRSSILGGHVTPIAFQRELARSAGPAFNSRGSRPAPKGK